MHTAVFGAEEEADAGGLERVRFHHQRNLPGFGEEALVDGLIGLGEEDLAAGVGVVPAYNAVLAGPCIVNGEDLVEPHLIRGGEREAGAMGMFALERGIVRDGEPVAGETAEQHAADLRASPRQGEKGIHHGQPDIIQYAGRGFDGERALGHAPRERIRLPSASRHRHL